MLSGLSELATTREHIRGCKGVAVLFDAAE